MQLDINHEEAWVNLNIRQIDDGWAVSRWHYWSSYQTKFVFDAPNTRKNPNIFLLCTPIYSNLKTLHLEIREQYLLIWKAASHTLAHPQAHPSTRSPLRLWVFRPTAAFTRTFSGLVISNMFFLLWTAKWAVVGPFFSFFLSFLSNSYGAVAFLARAPLHTRVVQ